MQASQLGFLHPDSIISKVFEFDVTSEVPLNQYFNEFGFKSMNCIRNMSLTFVIMLILITGIIITLILKAVSLILKWFSYVSSKMGKAFFWNTTFRLIIQQ